MTGKLSALLDRILPSKPKPEPESPPPDPVGSKTKPATRPMFASSTIPVERTPPPPKVEDHGHLVSADLMKRVVESSKAPLILPEERVALVQIEADALRLEEIEAGLRIDLYGGGSAGALSAFHRQRAEAASTAGGENPVDVHDHDLQSRENLHATLTLRKEATHEGLRDLGTALAKITGAIADRVGAHAGELADELEQTEVASHQRWGVIHHPSNALRALRAMRAGMRRWLPIAGCPPPRISQHPLLNAVMSTDGKGKSK